MPVAQADIADHGIIGDLQTAALVDTDGTIDWLCLPRFDAPSVFGSLLDSERGGYCSIRPDVDDYVTKQLYLPDTAILVTRFMTTAGVGEVVDFMPVTDGAATDRHRLVRLLRVVRGEMTFVGEIQPRFDYGRTPHTVHPSPGAGVMFVAGDQSLTVHRVGGPVIHGAERAGKVEIAGAGVRVTGSLRAGEVTGVMLESGGATPRQLSEDELLDMFDATRRYWRDWNGRSTYRGRWREMVARSAMTLKLMTYAPSGALVAAPTAGLPEQVGGERNWDYRYTWVRDASFSVYALLGLGYTAEAGDYVSWLMDRIRESAGTDSGPLKIMYRIDGSSDLIEETVDLAGYRGSTPVRIGNGAADQLQLDIYGEAMDSIHLADTHGIRLPHAGWTQVARMLDWVCENWDTPEEGIWETRGGRQKFTYGRFMSWVALDRGIRIAQLRGRPADIERWRGERDAIYARIMATGWHAARGAFVQHEDTDVLDASLLVMPQLGFIAPQDPMWLSTLDEMDRELVSDSLVYRYNPSASPDGLRGSEGTFTLCSFWYVDALARAGRLDEAQLTFEKMLTYANHLGLYAEEIGLTGEQLGNFPQAFSHLALINAAVNLDAQLDHRAGAADPVRRAPERTP